jgi:hypothetical protein
VVGSSKVFLFQSLQQNIAISCFLFHFFHFQIFVFSRREKLNESKLIPRMEESKRRYHSYHFFREVMQLMTSPATHCFSSQQEVFAYNWPLHRYREKHYNSFCHKCNHIYCRRVLCFSDHLYCNFLFLI